MTFRPARTLVAAGLLSASLLAGCADNEEPTGADVNAAATAVTPTVGETDARGNLAQESIEGRIGQTVALRGEVQTVLAPNAFTLGGEEIGENPVLVISRTAVPGLQDGATVEANGMVMRFVVADVDTWVELDLMDNEFEDFDNDPFLRADQARVTQGD